LSARQFDWLIPGPAVGADTEINKGKFMNDSLISQGTDLMLYGMGTVVVFLAILVIATSVMSWLIERFFPETPLSDPLSSNAEPASASPDARLLAVIKAAVEQYRNPRS
jgi:oxaloacetate decarboxylase gamma subunit